MARDGGIVMSFQLNSAFTHGELIPAKYTCDGENISPPLYWSNPPSGTQNYALIVDDPDTPTGEWVHWVLYNIPRASSALPESVPPDAELPDGSKHGQNSWGNLGYGGPCPPSGTHRYYFKLYALDNMLDMPTGSTKIELKKAMSGHILGRSFLMGLYSKP
jgi:Raf kinase inhibitor-like YbhB/YbcL family protein